MALPGSDMIAKAAQTSSGLTNQLKTAWQNTSKTKLAGGGLLVAGLVYLLKRKRTRSR